MKRKESVFDFRDYKAFLAFHMAQMPRGGPGFRSELAKALSCQTAYISQVLNGPANFSLEQGALINRLIGHSREESRFFLLILEYARAGSRELKTHFQELIEEAIDRHLNLKERFKVQERLSESDQLTYYSDWRFAAVHMLVSIPKFDGPERICEAVDLSLVVVRSTLEFLTRTGLVINEGGKYRLGASRLHLGKDSPLIGRHHANWRVQALKSLDRGTEGDLHYTSIVSLSRKDVVEIKKRLIQTIEDYNAVVKDSYEEAAFCLNVDFFGLVENGKG